MTSTKTERKGGEAKGPSYLFFVDGEEVRVREPEISGQGIMDLAGISLEVGLLLLLDDGTQRPVAPEEVFKLKPGHRFKKAPRFNRG